MHGILIYISPGLGVRFANLLAFDLGWLLAAIWLSVLFLLAWGLLIRWIDNEKPMTIFCN